MSNFNNSSRTWQRLGADGMAGGLTAVVFYAEYIGLGVVMGGALPGPGGAELGVVMVAGAVLLSCVLGAALRQPLLSGPRAASLGVLVAGMKFSSSHMPDADQRLAAAMAALAGMLVVAALVQLAGLLPRVRAWLSCTSVALRKGFIFSTAVGIVVGLGSAQLDGCLRVAPVWTCVVLAASVAAAVGWSRWWRSPACAQRPRLGAAMAPFSPLVGAGVAMLGYGALVSSWAAQTETGLIGPAAFCGAIGGAAGQGSASAQPWMSPLVLASAAASMPLWTWAVLALLGGLLGLVLLLESLTMLRESRDQTPPAEWGSHLKSRALANLIAAPLGFACSSLTIVRTNALIECGGRSRLAVLAHGLALVVILLFLRDWIAALPQLAVAVVLLLLAIQMIDEDTREQVWRAGYSRHAVPASVRAVWTFWCVVTVSMVCGSVLHYLGWGFGGGPLIALFAGTAWTGRRFMKQRQALARSRSRSRSQSRPGQGEPWLTSREGSAG